MKRVLPHVVYFAAAFMVGGLASWLIQTATRHREHYNEASRDALTPRLNPDLNGRSRRVAR